MAFGAGFLVAAARKALFAMRRRCAWLGIRDPALQCKLFDTLVLPILSYGCEVWGVNPKIGEAAELLHRDFLKRLLGVRKSTMNEIVLAELGRFPLQFHFWQQILRFHHRALALGKSRLVKLAFLEGATLAPDHEFLFRNKKCWQAELDKCLRDHLLRSEHTGQVIFQKFDVAHVIAQGKLHYIDRVRMDHEHPSLKLYVTLHDEYSYAAYLSAMKCWSNRRLLSRFRSGCHGLRVDTGRWEGNVHLDRGDRLCLVCNSSQAVEDEQHFLFDCPAYAPVRVQSADLFQQVCTVADFLSKTEPNARGGFIRNWVSLRSRILNE